MARSVAGQLAVEACKRFPRTPTLTLAKKLARENPKVFVSVEKARNRVRYYRGENGKQHRRNAKSTLVEVDKSKSLTVPESDATPLAPLVLSKHATGKGLIVGDIHFPYHDQVAVQLAFDHAIKKNHTDWLVLNGDILDCYQCSRWVRDPRKRDFASEVGVLRDFLGQVVNLFGVVIYKAGNHEKRYWDYMRLKAPELLDFEALEFGNLCGLKELGVTFAEPNQVIHAGELTIMHGHEYGRTMFSPVNPARGAFLRAHACTISGHLHLGSHHPEPDIRRRLTSCWSHGCLCDLSPEYAPLNRWNQTLLLVDFDGEDFEVTPRTILRDRRMVT